jgi:hypothetical protein
MSTPVFDVPQIDTSLTSWKVSVILLKVYQPLVFQIVLVSMGLALILFGVLVIIITFHHEKVGNKEYAISLFFQSLQSNIRVTKARIRDDLIIYPRCRTAAIENDISIVTPWKDYFTHDEQPFQMDIS